TYINLFDTLTIDDYYTTDSHWKQQNLEKVVAKLGSEMGFEAKPTSFYEAEKITDFQGVYARQLAVGNMSDELITLNSDAIRNASVFSHTMNTKQEIITTELPGVYNTSKLSSPDKYDVFLSGMQGLLTVENNNAPQKRELVIFRDSFGSSLTPLMLENYSKITLVDMRYASSGAWSQLIDFENCDVLFIFSPDILNQSHMLMP
ncbi:MAG: DHHW family protein, partial [Acutalibacteraceae bacterium]|nr:DHHW family protein [Acutalibacteraceae bacterium]